MTSKYLLVPLDSFNELSYNDKLVLSQLAYNKKAFETLQVSNAYLKKQLGISIRTIQRCLNNLSRYDYIKIDLKNNTDRIITLSNEVLNVYGIKTVSIHQNVVKIEKNPILQAFLSS